MEETMKRVLAFFLVLAALLAMVPAVLAVGDGIIFCSCCGKKIFADSNFCQFCGTEVRFVEEPGEAPAAEPELPYAADMPGKPEAGEIVKLGAYEQDNKTGNGKESIEWIVLSVEEEKALLLSRYALDSGKIDEELPWDECALRGWLNGAFLADAFSAEEQELLEPVMIREKTDRDPDAAVKEDKVFIFSEREAEKFFEDEWSRQCVPTAYAVSQGAAIRSSGGTVFCRWLLRPSAEAGNGAVRIGFDGELDDGDSPVYAEYSKTDGVRPAVWIRIDLSEGNRIGDP